MHARNSWKLPPSPLKATCHFLKLVLLGGAPRKFEIDAQNFLSSQSADLEI